MLLVMGGKYKETAYIMSKSSLKKHNGYIIY